MSLLYIPNINKVYWIITGPLTWAHAFNNCSTDLFPLMYSCQLTKIRLWIDRYCCLCMRFNFFSETSLTYRAESLASLCSSISRYNGIAHLPQALLFNAWCQPSISLLVLTAIMNTHHVEGGQMVLVIQVEDTYAMNCASEKNHTSFSYIHRIYSASGPRVPLISVYFCFDWIYITCD